MNIRVGDGHVVVLSISDWERLRGLVRWYHNLRIGDECVIVLYPDDATPEERDSARARAADIVRAREGLPSSFPAPMSA